ncbi:TolC family protein [Flavobacteriaceae bacterium M23B6Z8]
MKKYSFHLILFAFLMICKTGFTQESLTIDEAVDTALKQNYSLRVANNEVSTAEVDTKSLNSGFLPRITIGSGVNYANEDQSVTFADGNSTAVSNAITESYNASITAEYTIFDGFERKFTNRRNKQYLSLKQLEEKQQIENTIVNIYESYYQIAFQKQVVENLKYTIRNSQDRLDRARRKVKYGQGTQLDILTAKVDLGNDSITYRSSLTDLTNLKRNLNFLMGRDPLTSFTIDTLLVFQPQMNKDSLLMLMKSKNTQLMIAEQNLTLAKTDILINRAKLLPKINGSGSYQWSQSDNPPTSFALSNEIYGVNLGINLSWSLFDGGKTKTAVKKAKITSENRSINYEELEEQLKVDLYNAYETYLNEIYKFQTEESNVEVNRLNFQRTQKQYGLGQITTVEFRQAQINLFNALNNYAQAKYNVKLAEVNLLLLSGTLVD